MSQHGSCVRSGGALDMFKSLPCELYMCLHRKACANLPCWHDPRVETNLHSFSHAHACCPCVLTSTAVSEYWLDSCNCPSILTRTAVIDYWLGHGNCPTSLTSTAVRMLRQTWQEPPSESAAQLPSASAASRCTAWSAQQDVLSLGPAFKPSFLGTGQGATQDCMYLTLEGGTFSSENSQ